MFISSKDVWGKGWREDDGSIGGRDFEKLHPGIVYIASVKAPVGVDHYSHEPNVLGFITASTLCIPRTKLEDFFPAEDGSLDEWAQQELDKYVAEVRGLASVEEAAKLFVDELLWTGSEEALEKEVTRLACASTHDVGFLLPLLKKELLRQVGCSHEKAS